MGRQINRDCFIFFIKHETESLLPASNIVIVGFLFFSFLLSNSLISSFPLPYRSLAFDIPKFVQLMRHQDASDFRSILCVCLNCLKKKHTENTFNFYLIFKTVHRIHVTDQSGRAAHKIKFNKIIFLFSFGY